MFLVGKQARYLLGAVALAGVTGWAMATVGQPKSEPAYSSTITAGSPAVVEVPMQGNKTSGSVVLDLSVTPKSISGSGSLVLKVELFDPADLKRDKASAKPVATGEVAFYPPATVGQQRQFTTVLLAQDGRASSIKNSIAVVSLGSGSASSPAGGDELKLDTLGVRQ